jgi:hypothetical protein
MRFAMLDIDGRSRPVIISDDAQQFAEVRRQLAGFDGDMVDLIAAVPEPAKAFAKIEGWQPLAGRVTLAPVDATCFASARIIMSMPRNSASRASTRRPSKASTHHRCR